MVAWVLNLDAEEELAAKGGAYTPSAAMRARVTAMASRLVGLVLPGDVVLDADGARRAEGQPGDAWCLTPRAQERLRRAGAVVPEAPSRDVLRAVNARAFCAALGQTLPGAVHVTRAEDALSHLSRPPRPPRPPHVPHLAASRGDWLLKRPFGFAGRGRRKVRGGALTKEDCAFIAATLRDQGGLQVEPYVDRLADFALHGVVGRDGAHRLGCPTVQRCDEHGAWLSTAPAGPGDLSPGEEEALGRETDRVARALAGAGYFGPFGVDAYRYRDGSGAVRFNPRSEINARYAMGWAIGMSAIRSTRT